MKAFETKTSTYQEHYKTAMKEIKKAIKRGKLDTWITEYSERRSFLNAPYEVINKLQEEGYDLILSYDSKDNLIAVNISWENSSEGRTGVVTINRKKKTPVQSPNFWKRFNNFFSYWPEDSTM